MPYQPINFTKFGRGMMTLDEANQIPDDACVFAQNVDISSGGGFGPRKGCTRFGNKTEGSGKILSTHTFKLRNGTQIPIRVRDTGSVGVWEWYNPTATAWEILTPTSTALSRTARWTFVDWNTSSEDRVYACNGVDAYRKWTGITSTVASNTATTLTLADASSFPSSGDVIVDGTSYSYSGKSTNQLTGLSSLPAFTVGEGVAIATTAPSITASPGVSQIMFAWEGRLWVLKNSVLAYSKSGNPEDFGYASPRVPGDGGLEDFPEGGGYGTGLAGRDENLIIMKEDVLRPFRFEQFDVDQNEVPVSRPLGFSADIGPQHFASVSSYLKEIFYVSRKGGLRQLTQALQTSQGTSEGLDVFDIYDAIRPTIQNYNFNDAVTVVYDKKVLVACKSDQSVTVNDIVIVYDIRTKGIVLYKGWQVNDWFIYDGDLYFGGSSEPNTFKCFDGYTDDGGPIESVFRTKRFDFGEPAIRKEIPLIFVQGLIADGTTITATINIDENGTRAQIERNIDSEGAYVLETVTNELGINELGVEPLAGTIDEVGELNTFRVYMTVPIKYQYNTDIIFRCTSEGGRYKITTIAPNPKAQGEPPANLKLST